MQLLFIPLLFSSILFANQTHVLVSEKPQDSSVSNEEEYEKGEMSLFDRYPPIYYSNANHRLCSITVHPQKKYILELEDGSGWEISAYEGKSKAVHWQLDHPLVITQNNRYFSKYTYRIMNTTNHTSVEANLVIGPIERGDFSRFIIEIDYDQKEITLNDNTQWEISYLDGSVFKDWKQDHYIILGTNSDSSFWDSEREALLINVNKNNFVRAKQRL
jgi:hypothetical protein